MKKYSSVFLVYLIAMHAGCALTKNDSQYTLEDVQGYWWESCDDPTVQFAIQKDRYSGDFEGDFKVRVEHGSLLIDQGAEPMLEFRIVTASPQRLVLRMVPDSADNDWILRSCAEN
jgi:hypothetical protein